MYFMLLILPLLGSLLSVNRKIGSYLGPILSTIIMTLTALLGTTIWIEVGFAGSSISLILAEWIITSNLLNIEWALVFDSLTAAMLIPVLYISALVQLYSLNYMSTDPYISRFFSYLSIFTFFMLILITAENLLVLFLGWEGVGLASYLLINFWYTRIAANLAALKAFILNRIGDWGLTIGIIFTICIIGDVSFTNILSIGLYINTNIIYYISILFLIGAAAKSAQFSGLHSWLASAMEGPTPVSALIHAATMVTAGVYLLIRLSPLLEWSSNSLLLITWLGGMSALLGAACGLLENDIKRVIAYSTTSQLGYMIIACGLSQYNLGLFHLINHAFFKALLFLSAGAIIHAIADQQDMRKMGSLILFLPFSYIGILLGSLSLMAFPFMTGFYSKDLLLELILIPYNYTRSIAYIFAILAAFLSAIYSIRLLIMTFISKPNFPLTLFSNKIIIDPSISMLFPLIFLTFGSIYFGYLTHEMFLGIGSSLYSNSIFIHPDNIALVDASMLPSFNSYNIYQILKILPLLTLIFFLSLFPFKFNNSSLSTNNIIIKKNIQLLSFYQPLIKTNNNFNKIICYSALTANHFGIFNIQIIYYTLSLSNTILRYWDRGLIETLGPYGIIKIIHPIAFAIEFMSSGRLINYALLTLVFPIAFVLLFFFCWDSMDMTGPFLILMYFILNFLC